MPVMPVDLSVGFDPDVIVVAAADEATANSLRYTVIKAGYLGDILFFNELMSQFSVRSAALRRAHSSSRRSGQHCGAGLLSRRYFMAVERAPAGSNPLSFRHVFRA